VRLAGPKCEILPEKQIKIERTGDTAHMAECLPSKHEADFNHQYIKKEKEKKKIPLSQYFFKIIVTFYRLISSK
jgi:hypothetical protein